MTRKQLTAAMFTLVLTTATAIALPPVEPMNPVPNDQPMPNAPTPRLGVKGFVSQRGGFQVVEVLPMFPAADAGLEAGDTIFAIDGTVVQQPADLNTLLDRVMNQKNGQLDMIVLNHRDNRFYNIQANLVTTTYQLHAKQGVAPVQGAAPMQGSNVRAKNVKVTPVKK